MSKLLDTITIVLICIALLTCIFFMLDYGWKKEMRVHCNDWIQQSVIYKDKGFFWTTEQVNVCRGVGIDVIR